MEFQPEDLDAIQARVGQQLEDLAQFVDQWLMAKSTINDDDVQGRFDAANNLLNHVEGIARDKKKGITLRGGRNSRLSTSTRRRLDEYKGNRSRKDLALKGSDGEDLREMQQWQDEINTWDLLRILSQIQLSKEDESLRNQKEMYVQHNKIHKFSPDTDLWTQFIFIDDSAREKKLVLEWLERCARDDQADIDTILGHFDKTLGEAETTWSHGWLSTREKIKSHKRFTSTKGATPVKSASIRAQNSSEILVTQLDPDAPTRQDRKLEKDDEKHDHAFWVVCYDMFRRGMTWQDILDWCEGRNEGWRAASLGAAQDLDRKSSRLCLAGPHAGTLWRRMCYKAAQEVTADRYERATYGLLAGDIPSVEPVCQSWTDWLYVNYNALLLRAFEEWLKESHPERFPSTISQGHALYDPISIQSSEDMELDDMNTTIRILGNEKFSDKAREAVYLLQGSFIAHSFDMFASNLGIAIAQVYGSEDSLLQNPPEDAPTIEFYHNCAQDMDTIRMAVHVLIIYKDLGFRIDERLLIHADNIILFYINYLRELRKYEAIPTYAKCLSNEEVVDKALGKLLFDITETSEQNRMVNLMDQADLNVVSILTEQYIHACNAVGVGPAQGDINYIDEFDFIKKANDDWAGWRVDDPEQYIGKVGEKKVLLRSLSRDDQRIVQSLQWFFRIQAPWSAAFTAVAVTMKQLLGTGRFLVALAITKFIPVSQMSLHISPLYLGGESVNIFQDDETPADEDEIKLDPLGVRKSMVPLKPELGLGTEEFNRQCRLDALRLEGLAAKEMQDLCLALEELIIAAIIFEKASASADDPDARSTCEEELGVLHSKIRPLLHSFMLPPTEDRIQDDVDLDTARSLQSIKRAYLPAILLTYNGLITFSSPLLGPEILLRSLDIANLLANDIENADLVTAIVDTGRMQDMVESLALSELKLIQLQQNAVAVERRKKRANGKSGVVRKKSSALSVKKRDWMGETLDLWDVNKAS